MKKIKLCGARVVRKVTWIDDGDFEELSKYKWYVNKDGYVHRWLHEFDDSHKRIKRMLFLHRAVAETPNGMDTDHVNMDKLDNRRSNLRVCSRSGNVQNRGKLSTNTSGHKCVFWAKDKNRWRVQIGANKKLHFIGYFYTLPAAIHARDKAIKMLHKEYGRI